MLGLGTKHLVVDGSVHCVVENKDVPVGRCLSCVALRAISRETPEDGLDVEIVRCDPELKALAN